MFGPLFGKELLEMARRRRYFVVRVLIGVVLLAGWWAALQGKTPTVEFKNLASLSSIGEGLFRAWATWSLWGVVILTPMLVCGVIAAEKDGRTFEILLTTLLTNREILVGKAASRLLLLLILIASSVPILAVASLYGGFDVAQVAAAAAVIGGTAVFVVAVSLYYSAITFKPYIALLRTLFFLAILWWLLPAIAPRSARGLAYSPHEIVAIATGEANYYAGRRVPKWQAWNTKVTVFGSNVPEALGHVASFAMIHLTIAGFLFWRTNHLLRKRLQPGKPPWIFTATLWLYRSLVSGARSSVERRKHSAGWSRLWSAEKASERLWQRRLERTIDHNPLLYRNLVANAFDPERFVAAIQILVGVAALAAFIVLAWQERVSAAFDQQFERVGLWALVGSTSLLLVCSTILAASAFARERQYGSWEVLTLTDLPPRLHLAAAIKGVRTSLRLLFLVTLALALVVGYVWSGFVPMAAWAVSMAALWFLIVVYALWTSLFYRTIAGALAATVMGLVVLLLGPSLFPSRASALINPTVVVFVTVSALTTGVYIAAFKGRAPWTGVHIGTTFAAAALFVMTTTDDLFESGPGLTRLGDFYISRRSDSAMALVAFPLTWGRRFAYGLTETVPDPRLPIAFATAAASFSLIFIASFRSLAAAEPGERTLRRRASPRASQVQGVG
jgi:ABC-type transport system involved in multi-copper enzyme maturation permease subunit